MTEQTGLSTQDSRTVGSNQEQVQESDETKAIAKFRDLVFDEKAGGVGVRKAAFEREAVEQAEKPPTLREEDVAKMTQPERIKVLAEDAKKGAWSDNAKVVFAQIFKDARAGMPGISSADLLREIQVRTVREINKEQIKQNGPMHMVTLAQANGRNGLDEIIQSSYFVQLHGGQINEADTVNDLRAGRETPSNLRVGKIDWLAERKAYEEGKTALVETIKTEGLAKEWTAAGKKACQDLFTLVGTKPDGTTITDVKNDLQAITKDITASLKEKGSENFVDLVAAATPGNADFEFYMLLSKNKAEQQANLDAIQDGKPKDTYVKMGEMNIRSNGNALQISDQNRGLTLFKETMDGSWSPTTQETWRRIFNDTIEKVGNDPAKVRAELGRYTGQINPAMAQQKPGQSLDLVTRVNEKTGELDFFIQLNKKRGDININRGANQEAIFEGKDIDSSVKAGSIKIKDFPARKPGRNAA